MAGAGWAASFLFGVVAAIAVYLASRERTTEEKAADPWTGRRREGADLRDADLAGAHLRGADLREADLRGARLLGADLRFAILSGDLRGAVFAADFRPARLEQAVLAHATWDATTRRPAGFDPAVAAAAKPSPRQPSPPPRRAIASHEWVTATRSCSSDSASFACSESTRHRRTRGRLNASRTQDRERDRTPRAREQCSGNARRACARRVRPRPCLRVDGRRQAREPGAQ